MERYKSTAEVDRIFGEEWLNLSSRLRPEAIPVALQRATSRVAGMMPPDYVPPHQRSAPLGAPLSENRKDMLALVEKWYGTTLSAPRVPPGETKDLLARAGWTKQIGADKVKVREDNEKNGTHNPIVTSCGDVLRAALVLWKSCFLGAFMIRGVAADGHSPGAKPCGYYIEATGSNKPVPGDILVLRNGVGPGATGVGHVDIFVSMREENGVTKWTTADGGAGRLPDPSAQKTEREVTFDARGIAILGSPTDGLKKQLDGWIDLDRMPREA